MLITTIQEQFLRLRKSTAFQMVTILAGGNMLSSFLRLGGGLLTARMLSPTELGLFNGISLVLGYLPIIQLGILNGLNRELPYYLGKNDTHKALDLASTAKFLALLLSVISFIVFFLVSCYFFFIRKDILIALGWLANSFAAFSLFFSQQYLTITYRTNNDFKKLSKVSVFTSTFAFIGITFVYLLGYLGLVIRNITSGLFELSLLYKWRPLHVKPKIKLQNIIELFKIGAPIFTVGYIYSLWEVINSTLIVRMLGVQKFGYYQLSIILNSTLLIIPLSFTQVLYPRLSFEYGKNGDAANITSRLIKPLSLLFVSSILISAITWLILPRFVTLLLPNYFDGIEAARFSLGLFIIGSLSPIHIIFNIIKKQSYYLFSIILGFIFYALTLFLFSLRGLELVDFPIAMVVGRTVFIIGCFILIFFIWYKSSSTEKDNEDIKIE